MTEQAIERVIALSNERGRIGSLLAGWDNETRKAVRVRVSQGGVNKELLLDEIAGKAVLDALLHRLGAVCEELEEL